MAKQQSHVASSPGQLHAARIPVTIDAKLSVLADTYGLTNKQIAVAAGCSGRAIEMRRRKQKQRETSAAKRRTSRSEPGIDWLYSVMALLVDRRHIEVPLARAFVLGLSAYLDDQAPIVLLGAGEFELVRAAALAFSAAQPPRDFIERYGPVPRVTAAGRTTLVPV